MAKRGNGLQFAILEWKSNSQVPSISDTFLFIYLCANIVTQISSSNSFL